MSIFTERQGTKADKQWLWEIYEALLKKCISDQWGWDFSFQEKLFEAEYKPEKFIIISSNGASVGAYLLNKESDHHYLKMLLVAVKYQNKGIGRKVMEKLKLLAKKEKKPLKLSVIKTNPVLSFYKNLGFKVIGEDDGSIKLEYDS